MKACYIDEAGALGALVNPPLPNDQPVLVVSALIVDTDYLYNLTHAFLRIKHQYFPGLAYISQNHLDRILPEIKGADVRANAVRGSGKQQRHAIGFLDRIMGLLARYGVKITARIWVKGIGSPFNPISVYTYSIQGICMHFDHYLNHTQDVGFCIADSRNKFKNISVSHSVFTQKFSSNHQGYGKIIELPTFGHSDNHAGLQICDIMCSALLYPIACYTYCSGYVKNIHVQPRASVLKTRYDQTIKNLQYRYFDEVTNRYRGGLVVSDAIQQRSAALMFR